VTGSSQIEGINVKLPRRQFLHLAAGAAALPAFSRLACAQSYPAKPVLLVVQVSAGSAPDIIARVIGQWLSERLGQQLVVDNRVGASGNIGTEAVVRAPADGYTLLFAMLANAIKTKARLADLGCWCSRARRPSSQSLSPAKSRSGPR
jgi:tripartite-type tricarboxylate transporter receptor subunit TctC